MMRTKPWRGIKTFHPLGYSCSLRKMKKESSLKQVKCESCGKIFKTNRDTDYVLIAGKIIIRKFEHQLHQGVQIVKASNRSYDITKM